MGARSDDARRRRANENRASRQALAARKEAASRKAASSQPVEQEASGVLSRSRQRTRAQAAPVVSAARAAPRGSPASDPEQEEPPAHGILARTRQLPGGRSVLAGFVMALVGSAALLFAPIARKSESDRHLQSLLQVAGLQAVPFAAIPAVIAAVPLLFINHRWRRAAWSGAAFMLGLWVLLMRSLGVFHILAAGFTVFGVIKASRVDGRSTPMLRRGRLAPARPGNRDEAEADAAG